ncbi:HAMP domain-containing histidine kinase [Synechococcus sp. HK05]|uniref:sensor histidine kinase n=1 Tax=Synechococcus sp. HK05 TaxID=2725975 RepID=UPI001C393A4E|nr:HAMP domain-containing sensor histidine kinase [Synechococcus sp. HK05]MBV2352700.1 HAMP domain-containing histidine kinase [Synechococcus sp. HK05]
MRAGANRFRGFTGGDSLRLLLCVASAWAGSFALLSLGMPKLLQTTTTQAISLSLARQANQLHGHPAGSGQQRPLRIWAAVQPPPESLPAQGQEAEALRSSLRDAGLAGPLRRDPPSQRSWLGGYWLAVQRSTAANPQLWVYASPGTALPWLWPAIRIGSLMLGGSSGMALFLQWQLQRPIQQLLRQLPAIPSGELELVPEGGMGAMRELSIRINRVLEQLNQQHESRRRFLQGLAHDLGSPLTRLSMRVERLEDQASEPTAWNDALPQLRVEIDRLISLTHLLQEAAGEQTEPFRPRLSALDELCERVAASYPQQPIDLAVPRLLVRLDQALIERALQNLIDNAIRYGAPPIRLAAQQQRNSVVLLVEDGGRGLSSANLLGMPRIAPADDRQQRNRSGVGLTIVERCCQLHGGRLALNRSSLGGLQAELHLPQS